MSIAPNDTTNIKMLATPIGRNCRKPWISATSDDARLTSWPVCSSSWLAKSRLLQLAEDGGAQVVLHVERDPPAAEAPEVGEHERQHTQRDHQREPRRERLASCVA